MKFQKRKLLRLSMVAHALVPMSPQGVSLYLGLESLAQCFKDVNSQDVARALKGTSLC